MSCPANVLVVDDEKDFLALMEDTLSDNFKVTAVDSANKCLDKIDTDTGYDVILLDVDLGDCTGFDLCQQIRTKPNVEQSEIIFVSGKSNDEDIVNGYKSGGSDYIVKPVRPKELNQKISTLISRKEKFESLKNESDYARKVAFSAMEDSSQLGQVIQFMDNSIECKTTREVVDLLLKTIKDLGFNSTVYAKTAFEKIVVSQSGDVRPIEEKLIEQVGRHERILDFNNRTLFNDKNISILIKNMPMHDDVSYGRMKDTGATLISAANSRIKSIINEAALIENRDAISALIQDIDKSMESQSNGCTQLMKDFMEDIQESVLTLGLTEAQEEYFFSMVDRHISQIVNIITESKNIERNLKKALNNIDEHST